MRSARERQPSLGYGVVVNALWRPPEADGSLATRHRCAPVGRTFALAKGGEFVPSPSDRIPRVNLSLIPNDRSLLWWIISIGVLDRAIILVNFGFLYTGVDDAVIWSAAVDFGRGVFLWPYFYGQDYSPMLEALVAAPFVRVGLPLHLVMPVVSSALALLPYWSFAIWNHRHARYSAALFFAAMPLLLPVEYGLITTITRGFVTGIALLSFLPWILDLCNEKLGAILIGTTLSLAWFVNPNSLVFAVGFSGWYFLSGPSPVQRAMRVGIGALPGLLAHVSAQAYCRSRPDRILFTIYDWRMDFHAKGILEGLSRLDTHFAWLAPVAWPFGQVVGELLLIILFIAIWKRQWPVAAGVACSMLLIVFSFAFAKVHDGSESVFFPFSRMFLALPLTVCWSASMLFTKLRTPRLFGPMAISCAGTLVVIRSILLPPTIQYQVYDQPNWCERPIDVLVSNEAHIRSVCDAYQVQLIVYLILTDDCPQVAGYLYPAIDPALPPTYLTKLERRHWIREEFAHAVMPNILLHGGEPEKWKTLMTLDPRFVDVSAGPDQLHVIVGNTIPTDSLAGQVMRMLNGR